MMVSSSSIARLCGETPGIAEAANHIGAAGCDSWLSTAEARDCGAIARACWGGWIRTTDYLIQSQEPYRLATPQRVNTRIIPEQPSPSRHPRVRSRRA